MIYVDDYISPKRVTRLQFVGHLFAAPVDEVALVAFGESIGLKKEWLQRPGTKEAHFDVTKGMRFLALCRGAKEVSTIEGARLRNRLERAWRCPECNGQLGWSLTAGRWMYICFGCGVMYESTAGMEEIS